MRITSIRLQVKRQGRYSVFVDGKFAFSLSEAALLDSKLASGSELGQKELAEYKKLSADDKLYQQTLRWVAMRSRSHWEVESYLERKNASPTLNKLILSKLRNIGLIDDNKLATTYVSDRYLLRPASRRKIIAELRKKHLPEKDIKAAFKDDEGQEQAALLQVIANKRRQAKYRDNLKLMQYLARQGFNYDDIKQALRADANN